MNSDQYDEKYFSTLNYVGYLGREQRYHKLARELDNLLDLLGISNPSLPVLDYGCSVGFLLKGLKRLGYTDLSGFDISTWAVSQAIKSGLDCVFTDPVVLTGNYYLTISLDVFEHMDDVDLIKLLSTLKTKYLIVRIPVVDETGEFKLEVSRKDPTHINKRTSDQWITFLSNWFVYLSDLNLNTIWSSEGVHTGLYRSLQCH